jgi:hypothetical protein
LSSPSVAAVVVGLAADDLGERANLGPGPRERVGDQRLDRVLGQRAQTSDLHPVVPDERVDQLSQRVT